MSAKDPFSTFFDRASVAASAESKGRLDLLKPLLAAAQSVDKITLAQSKRLRSKARGALRLVVLIETDVSGIWPRHLHPSGGRSAAARRRGHLSMFCSPDRCLWPRELYSVRH